MQGQELFILNILINLLFTGLQPVHPFEPALKQL